MALNLKYRDEELPAWRRVESFTGLEVDIVVTPESFLRVYEGTPGFHENSHERYGVQVPKRLLPEGLVDRILHDRRLATGYMPSAAIDREDIIVTSKRRPTVGPAVEWTLIDNLLRRAMALNHKPDSIFHGHSVRLTFEGHDSVVPRRALNPPNWLLREHPHLAGLDKRRCSESVHMLRVMLTHVEFLDL